MSHSNRWRTHHAPEVAPAEPRHAQEEERLRALHGYAILDSAADAVFDDLTALAARFCASPIAFVSFVDDEREWCKSAVGVPLRELSRELSFGAHTICQPDGTLVVPNLSRDPRFATHPLVTGSPGLRFYGAVALRSPDRYPVGTLAVLDLQPRTLAPMQLDVLRRFGRYVTTQLEMTRTLRRFERHSETQLRAQEAHRASERFHASKVRQAAGLICAHDVDGRLRRVNEAASHILGYNESELLGRSLRDFIAPGHLDEFDEYLGHMALASTFTGLLVVRHRSGRDVPLAYQAFRHDSPSDQYVVGHAIDITARIAAEDENRRFAAVLDASPDLVAMADTDGRTTYLNRAGREMCGLPVDADVRGLAIRELHSRDAAQVSGRGAAHALQHGAWVGESAFRHRSGIETPVAQTIVAPRNGDGPPEFLATIARDVTRQKLDERLLRESERRFRQVVDNVRDVLFELDAAGRWQFLNPAWTGITGFEVRDTLGHPFLEFIHDEDVAVSAQRFQELVAGMVSVCRYEVRYLTKCGQPRWLETHARCSGESEPCVIVGTLRDVTVQHEMAQQLVAARETAERASRMMSEFVANMSHEVRTPLNGVLGLTAALLDTRLDEHQRRMTEAVHESGQALLTIANDVLDLSKIEAGKLSIEQVSFDLTQLLEGATAPAAVRAGAKGIGFRRELAADLPQRLVGDPVRIRQVILNFADNAVKFTPRGEVVVSVGRGAGPSPTLRVVVSDTGIGIPREKQALIFEQFVQADTSTTREFGGTGLGLSICRQLVALMQGTLGLDSEPGRGSSFWFELPLIEAPAGADAAPSGPVAAWRAPDLHILVAEDNATNQMVIQLHLQKMGCRATMVDDGAQAVERARETPFDAILMDGQMPVMDGYEATRQIRAGGACRDVPIIGVTARAMSGDNQRCLEAGMTDYLSKPVRYESLEEVLRRAVESRPPVHR